MVGQGSAGLEVPPAIWFNGEVVPWERATVHVWTDVAQSGLSVFEGLRGYWHPDAGRHMLLHLDRHLDRLYQSARLARIPLAYPRERLRAVIDELLLRLDYRCHAYLRPTAYLEKGRYSHDPSLARAGAYVAAFPVERDPSIERGIRCMVSSWRRTSDLSGPPRIKAGANYYNIRLARMEADAYGFDEPILLNDAGSVAETGGASVFVLRNGELATPRVTDSILESLTRASVLELAREVPGLVVTEREVQRTELYAADEVFIAGTLAEVTPVVEIDAMPVGGGDPGPLTRRLRQRYTGICTGTVSDDRGWLAPGPVLGLAASDR
jgi:branched-chain amino acid aminotransferase